MSDLKRYRVVDGRTVVLDTDSRCDATKRAVEILHSSDLARPRIFERDRSGKQIVQKEIYPRTSSWCLVGGDDE